VSSPGDRACAAVLVRVVPEQAFRLFTEEIDLWWRRGPAYRNSADGHPSTLTLELGLGGRLLERIGEREEQRGTITRWEPPRHLSLEWRGTNFAPGERTTVEVDFEPRASGTFVTVTHSGWSSLRSDHPVRHGAETAVFIGRVGSWWGDLLTALRVHALPKD